jgi:hypothetical protein
MKSIPRHPKNSKDHALREPDEITSKANRPKLSFCERSHTFISQCASRPNLSFRRYIATPMEEASPILPCALIPIIALVFMLTSQSLTFPRRRTLFAFLSSKVLKVCTRKWWHRMIPSWKNVYIYYWALTRGSPSRGFAKQAQASKRYRLERLSSQLSGMRNYWSNVPSKCKQV